MKRKIVKRQYFRTDSHPKGARPSVLVTLECGHKKRYKGSKAPTGDSAYCDECGMLKTCPECGAKVTFLRECGVCFECFCALVHRGKR